MGSSKSASISQEPTVTPAVAKDAQMAQNMSEQQSQARALRRGIGATYTRFKPKKKERARRVFVFIQHACLQFIDR